MISQSSRTPRAASWSCSSRAHSLGAGGHLNGAPHTPITACPLEKPADGIAHPHGALDAVELLTRFGEPGRPVHVVVGAERDDQHVGLVGAGVRGDGTGLGIDRGDRLLQEADAGLHVLAVRQPDGLGLAHPGT